MPNVYTPLDNFGYSPKMRSGGNVYGGYSQSKLYGAPTAPGVGAPPLNYNAGMMGGVGQYGSSATTPNGNTPTTGGGSGADVRSGRWRAGTAPPGLPPLPGGADDWYTFDPTRGGFVSDKAAAWSEAHSPPKLTADEQAGIDRFNAWNADRIASPPPKKAPKPAATYADLFSDNGPSNPYVEFGKRLSSVGDRSTHNYDSPEGPYQFDKTTGERRAFNVDAGSIGEWTPFSMEGLPEGFSKEQAIADKNAGIKGYKDTALGMNFQQLVDSYTKQNKGKGKHWQVDPVKAAMELLAIKPERT